jgi:hypothetical protein
LEDALLYSSAAPFRGQLGAHTLRSFEGVSWHFAEAFSELVPGGRASLVMLKSEEAADGEAPWCTPVVKYTGVTVKVCLCQQGRHICCNNLAVVGSRLLPLVSSLRFSVWSLAPFFLFDEIDADLVATYQSSDSYVST